MSHQARLEQGLRRVQLPRMIQRGHVVSFAYGYLTGHGFRNPDPFKSASDTKGWDLPDGWYYEYRLFKEKPMAVYFNAHNEVAFRVSLGAVKFIHPVLQPKRSKKRA